MRVEEGARLRAQWSAKGQATCQHDSLSIEESMRNILTGAYVCTRCGELFKTSPWSSWAT